MDDSGDEAFWWNDCMDSGRLMWAWFNQWFGLLEYLGGRVWAWTDGLDAVYGGRCCGDLISEGRAFGIGTMMA